MHKYGKEKQCSRRTKKKIEMIGRMLNGKRMMFLLASEQEEITSR